MGVTAFAKTAGDTTSNVRTASGRTLIRMDHKTGPFDNAPPES